MDIGKFISDHKEVVWIGAAGLAGVIAWSYIKNRSSAGSTTASTTGVASTTSGISTDSGTQYLIPTVPSGALGGHYGSGGSPDRSKTTTTAPSTTTPATTTQQMPYIAPATGYATSITGLSSALGQGAINPNTNPGFDTFHLSNANLTVDTLASDIYPETTPTEALSELEYYNPQLGDSPQAGSDTLSNNFITIPNTPGELPLASQAA